MDAELQARVMADVTHSLEGLMSTERVGVITPWRLPDGAQIGWQVFSRQANSRPLSIDVRLPASDAVRHPADCPVDADGLYRLHTQLFSESCATSCLFEHGSVAALLAHRCTTSLAVTLGVEEERIRAALLAHARPLRTPRAADAALPVEIRPLADVLFA